MHPFGQTGFDMGPLAFSAYWLKALREGKASRLEEYSLQAVAAYAGKFMRPDPGGELSRWQGSPMPCTSMPRCLHAI